MVTRIKEVEISEVLLADQLSIDRIRTAGHLTRQYVTIRSKVKKDIDAVFSTNKSHKETRVAAAYWILGDKNSAAEHARKEAAHPVSQMILGLIAEDAHKLNDALTHYEKAAEKLGSSEASALQRIGVMRQLGKVDDAMKMLTKLEREFSGMAAFFYHRGRCLELRGQYEEALAAFEQALSLEHHHAESLFHAARILDNRGCDVEAIKYYERISRDADDTYINAMLNLATLYEDNHRETDALRCCISVLSQQPTNRRAKMISESVAASAGMFYSPEETKQSEKLEAILRTPVTDFELSVRSRNCLTKMNIKCLGDLVKRTESEMLAYKNFGETSLREIRDMLNSRNLRLGMLREDAATRAAYNRSTNKMREEILQKSIDVLDLSVRSRKCMERLAITTVGQLCEKSELELESAKNFGRVSLNEIKKRLIENNLALRASD